jgi:hypothetical protein
MHNPNGGLAGSTILLYLAVTYTAQRVIMQARAQRLPSGGGQAGSFSSGGGLTGPPGRAAGPATLPDLPFASVTRHN